MLNNREVAILIWFGVIAIFALKSKDIRASIATLVESFKEPLIRNILLLSALYSSWLIYLLNLAGLWEFALVKEASIWFVTIAFAVLFKHKDIAEDSSKIKKLVISTISLVVVIQFVSTISVFSLPVELLITPIVVLVSMMLPIAESKAEYGVVLKMCNRVLVLIGSVFIVKSCYDIVLKPDIIFSVSKFRSFVIMPVLTILYIPFLLTFSWHVAYDDLFRTFKLNETVWYKRIILEVRLILLCRFNYKKLDWLSRYANYLPRKERKNVTKVISDVLSGKAESEFPSGV